MPWCKQFCHPITVFKDQWWLTAGACPLIASPRGSRLLSGLFSTAGSAGEIPCEGFLLEEFLCLTVVSVFSYGESDSWPERSAGQQIRSDIRGVVAHSAVIGGETLFGETVPSETVSDRGFSERGFSSPGQTSSGQSR